jgi:peptidyl-prolyl cis-trans isomerase D
MAVGEIRGPVKTQFGYLIIKLEEIQAGKGKSFEEARAEIEAQLRKDRATDHFGDIQEQLQSKLQDPNADLNALAQQYHMQTGDVPSFAKGAGAPPLGLARPLQDLVFADPPLGVGKLGGPVLVGDDRLVIAKVLEHRKPEPRPMSEVRDGIVTTLTKDQGTQAALAAAQAARGKLAGGASIEAVAQELKVSAEPAHFIGRTDPSVPAQVRDAAFALPVPAAGKPAFSALTLNTGGAAVLAVSAVRTGAVHDDKERLARTREEAERLGSDAAAAYVEEVRRGASVKKNPNAFD